MLGLAVLGSHRLCAHRGRGLGADADDYSEWQTGRRFTGIVFATIGFVPRLAWRWARPPSVADGRPVRLRHQTAMAPNAVHG